MKKIIIILISLIVVAGGAAAYVNRMELMIFFQPRAYIDQVRANTLETLSAELKSFTDNKILKQYGNIFMSPSEHDFQINLEALEISFLDMKQLDVRLQNDNTANIFAATSELPQLGQVGLYITDDKLIASLIGNSVFVDSARPINEICDFADSFGLEYSPEVRESDLDVSYSNLEAKIEELGRKGKEQPWKEYYDLLVEILGKSTMTVEKRQTVVNGVDKKYRVTNIQLKKEDAMRFLQEIKKAFEAPELDESVKSLIDSYGYSEDIARREQSLEDMRKNIEAFEEDLSILLYEDDMKYRQVEIISKSNIITLVAFGETNMLDILYVKTNDDSGEYLITAEGSHVLTDRFTTNISVSSPQESFKITLDWNMAGNVDNLSFSFNNMLKFDGTLATEGEDVIIHSGQLTMGGVNMMPDKDIVKYRARKLNKEIEVPSSPTRLEEINFMDYLPLVFMFNQ